MLEVVVVVQLCYDGRAGYMHVKRGGEAIKKTGEALSSCVVVCRGGGG